MADCNLYIHIVNEAATDTGTGLKFNLQHYNGQSAYDIVVYSDNVEVASSAYTFDGGNDTTLASITFSASQSGNTITCDYTWKYSCADDEDCAVYAVEKTLNV